MEVMVVPSVGSPHPGKAATTRRKVNGFTASCLVAFGRRHRAVQRVALRDEEQRVERAGARDYASARSWLRGLAARARESVRRVGAFVVGEELCPACLGDLVLHGELGPSVLDEPGCDREDLAAR